MRCRSSGGKPLISREGAWDELGWDDARKAQEREYFDREDRDPELERLLAKTMGGADTGTD